MSGKSARIRGIALVLVLWMVVLVSALVGAFALAANKEALQGRVFRQDLVLRQAARAGVDYAVLRLMHSDPQSRWLADGSSHEWSFGDADLTIRIRSEAEKTDLNNAGAADIEALLRKLGVESGTSARIAVAVVDWRDPDPLTQPGGGAEDPDYAFAGRSYGAKDARFDDVSELQQVLGMTPALYALVEPHLTVHGVSGTYSIESRARLGDGRTSALHVVLRTGASEVPGAAYTALRWEEGEISR